MILRPFDPDRDGPALHAVFGDEESCRFLIEPAKATVEETVRLLRDYTSGIETSSWAVCESAEGPALGRVAMLPRGPRIVEAAVMFAPAARGRGLATRALGLGLDHAFGAMNARRVYADIDPDNAPSLRLFERLGFRREGVLRATWETHIGVRDTVLMAIIEDDLRPWRTA